MRRVLIVTDSRDVAESMQVLLSMFGHEVEFALDAATALERGSTFRPTVALIDADLGEGNPSGYEVAQQLRTVLGSDVFLVVHTAYGLNEVRASARKAGFDAYLGKPATPEELEELLKESGRTGPLWDAP